MNISDNNIRFPATTVIIGPTASGKTKLSLRIEENLAIPNWNDQVQWNVVNYDSRQFWQEMKILTCSPTDEEKSIRPHYLFNYLSREHKPNLGAWYREIAKIENKILVGGTIFYIRSLYFGIPCLEIDENIRNQVEAIDNLEEYFRDNYSHFIGNLNFKDTYRVKRKLEFILQTGQGDFGAHDNKYTENLIIYALMPEKEKLLNNIEIRTKSFLDDAIKEVTSIDFVENYKTIIGYEEIWQYYNKEISYEKLYEEIVLKTYQYAKYQLKFIKSLSQKIPMQIIT
jgi:tRNA dimethylallyltransferase